MSVDAPPVLFVCVQNAGRSQMAAALLALMTRGRVDVLSAGSRPAEQVHPVVVEAMREVGIDLSRAKPRPIADSDVREADVVVTMGCGDECPYYPGKRYVDWDVADPAGQPIEAVRAIRDDIAGRVRTLIDELGVDLDEEDGDDD